MNRQVQPVPMKLMKWSRYAALTLLFVTTTILTITLYKHATTAAGGSDSSDYIHNSRLIAEGKLFADVRQIADIPVHELRRPVYQPLGFETSPELDKQTPIYPFGYSIVLAIFRILAGEDLGILLATILIGCLTPIATYRLAREIGLSAPWSSTAALVIAISPLYLFMALQTMSDAISTLLCTVIVLLAFLAKKSWWQAFLLGTTISLAILIRTPNTLIVLPVACILLSQGKSQKWMSIMAGALPGFMLFCWLNNELYGSPLSTGYNNIFALFKLEYFPMTMGHFAKWLTVLHSPAITLPALASLFFIKKGPLHIAVLWLWAAAFTIFYAFYYHSHETWWYLRFILPALPPIVIAACFCLEQLARKAASLRRLPWFPIAAAFVASLYFGLHRTKAYEGRLYFDDPSQDNYRLVSKWLEENAAETNIYLCMQNSGCIYYYSDNAIVRYDHLNSKDWSRIREAVQNGPYNLFALLFNFELEEKQALTAKAPGSWTPLSNIHQTRIFQLEKDYIPEEPAQK